MTRCKPKRRWYQFSLLTLLVVVSLMSVGTAWLSGQFKWIRARQEALAFNRDAPDGTVCFIGIEGDAAPWSIRILGAPGFSEVYVMIPDASHPTKHEQIARRKAEQLFPEADVQFWEGPMAFSLVPPERIHGGGGFF